MNLQSRTATFCLQFIQRLLSGSSDCGWRAATCAILRTLGGLQIDTSLLFGPPETGCSQIANLLSESFKVWSLFNLQRTPCMESLFWLLNEPIVHGARLDISIVDFFFPGLNNLLCKSRITTLGLLLNVAGPNFSNTERVASHPGVFLTRTIAHLMVKWQSALTNEERQLLTDYYTGAKAPNAEDPFSTIYLSPKLDDCVGLFLKVGKSLSVDFFSVTRKMLYKLCVWVFNKNILDSKVGTP